MYKIIIPLYIYKYIYVYISIIYIYIESPVFYKTNNMYYLNFWFVQKWSIFTPQSMQLGAPGH